MKFSKYLTIIGISACLFLTGGCSKSDTSGSNSLKPTDAVEVAKATGTPETSETTVTPEIPKATKTPETAATSTTDKKTPIGDYKETSYENPAEFGEWFYMNLSAFVTQTKGGDSAYVPVNVPFRVMNAITEYEEVKRLIDEYNSTSNIFQYDLGEYDPNSDGQIVIFEYEILIPQDYPMNYYSDSVSLPTFRLGVTGSKEDGVVMVNGQKFYLLTKGYDISPNYGSTIINAGDTLTLRLVCSIPKGADADSYFLTVSKYEDSETIYGYSKGIKIDS